MKDLTQRIDKERFVTAVYWLLVILLYINIIGFFSWSENVAVTRSLKIALRLFTTGTVFICYIWLIRKGLVSSFKMENSLAFVFYGLYLFLGLFSFIWSTDPNFSALQWFMDIQALVFAYFFIKIIVMVREYFPEGKVRLHGIIGDTAFFILCIFLIGRFIQPDVFYRMTHSGEEARLGGWMMNPNELGMLCVVGISCLIFGMYERNKFSALELLKIILMLYALLLTGSRSSMTGLFVIILFYIFLSKKRIFRIAALAVSGTAILLSVKFLFIKEGGVSEVLNMTGRVPFWKALLTEGLPQRPLLGFGFMRIANGDYFQSVHTYAGEMTHNTFIQVLMNLGMVGLLIVLIQMAFTFRAFLFMREKQKQLMLIGLFIPIFINSFTEFGIFGENNYGILFYQFILFYICLQYNPLLSLQEKLHQRKFFGAGVVPG